MIQVLTFEPKEIKIINTEPDAYIIIKDKDGNVISPSEVS